MTSFLKLSRLVALNPETLSEGLDPQTPIEYIEISDVKAGIGIANKTAMKFSAAPSRARRKVREDDVLVSTVRTYLKAIGRVTPQNDGAIASTGFAVLRPKANVSARYLSYALETPTVLEEIALKSTGISYPAINSSELMRIAIPMREFEEQHRVVHFLDREIAKIDETVCELESTLILLNEHRQVLISETVTRGIPGAHTEFKDSGVPWLGSIPATWSLRKFQRLFTESKEINGSTPVGNMLSISGYRGVEEKRYEHESQKRTAKQLEAYRVVKRGQLAVNTMWLNHTGLGVSDLEGHMSPAYRAYWINPELWGRYVHYLLRSAAYVSAYIPLLTGVRPNSLQMSTKDLNSFPILIPPLSEQEELASYLDDQQAESQARVAAVKDIIALLKEKRSALIREAVTGQLVVG